MNARQVLIQNVARKMMGKRGKSKMGMGQFPGQSGGMRRAPALLGQQALPSKEVGFDPLLPRRQKPKLSTTSGGRSGGLY
jgi:hypothetical protein